MGFRFDPSSTPETSGFANRIQNLATEEWKKQKLAEEQQKQLVLLQRMGLIDGMPEQAAQGTVAPSTPAPLTTGNPASTGSLMPPGAMMSMKQGGVGDINAQPLEAIPQETPQVQQQMPMKRASKPFIAMPNAKGGFSFIKNPAYGKETNSPLSTLDLTQIASPKTPDERKQIIDSLPPEIGENVKLVGTYRQDVNKITSLRKGSEDRLKFDALMGRLYPDMVGEKGFDTTEYTNRNNFQKSFFDPNRPTGMAINAIKQTSYHLGDLHDNVTALVNTGSPLLNKPLQWWEKNAQGDPTVSAVLTDLTAVSEEMTKAWAGNNNGEMRVREWRKSMDAANSPEQWKAVMSTAANLLDGAVKARQSSYKATMKRDIDLLDPDQKDILDKLKSDYSQKTVKSVADELTGKTKSGLSYTISR